MAIPTFRPDAVFWDMDGTLIDTEPYWFAAEKRLVHRFGGTWTDADCYKLVGLHLPKGAELLRAAGVKLPISEIVKTLIDDVCAQTQEELVLRPGAIEMLQLFSAANIPQALVTMSQDPLVSTVVQALEELVGKPVMSVVVTGDQVQSGKPDPEAYHIAFSKMAEYLAANQQPTPILENCVIFEDSLVGVAAGEASGMTTIGIPHAVPVPVSNKHTQWRSLAYKNFLDVANAHKEQHSLSYPR